MLVEYSAVTEVPISRAVRAVRRVEREESEEHSFADLLFRHSGRISRSAKASYEGTLIWAYSKR